VPAAATPAPFAADAGRSSKLLASAWIYTTPEGKAQWEAQARANIARELAALKLGGSAWGRMLRWLSGRLG
jgi:hypothetical protein